MIAQNMVLTWGPNCDFIFSEWQTTDWPQFWTGVGITFLTCFIATSYGPIFHKQIKIQSKSKLGLTFGYLIEYLLKLYVTLLMMTMNAYVCFAIALGTAVGYSIFSCWGEMIRTRYFGTAYDRIVSIQM